MYLVVVQLVVSDANLSFVAVCAGSPCSNLLQKSLTNKYKKKSFKFE